MTHGRHQAVIAHSSDQGSEKRENRLAFFEEAIGRLLAVPENRDYVVFEMRGSPDSYVQYRLHDGAVHGEVSTKGWIPGSELLDRERITALGCLGFESSGLVSNFVRTNLPLEPRRLACLTELLFGAANRPVAEFDVTVSTKPRVEAAGTQRRSLAIEA